MRLPTQRASEVEKQLNCLDQSAERPLLGQFSVSGGTSNLLINIADATGGYGDIG
ncbi:hypothetical protein PS726_00382 [Pseudomonas fluorescens]|uniref:hypothetical protein n=1 Tax=Pseudomonas fluorescens TaxID=294 RepID=UPI001254C9ED|nr:hypothetical protein [Pseudomonas fluorescens]VVN70529.1 hypothetical protein PS726_00382 [Pseudomonas fluorescens]